MPVPHTETYTSRSGVHFDIAVAGAPVPHEADYFGYYFRVRDTVSRKHRAYAAMIKKNTCATEDEANVFVTNGPLEHLKHAMLDRYENGSHPMLWPDQSAGWVIV
jgi:hypothetical protein